MLAQARSRDRRARGGRRSQESREAILSAAIETFYRHGFRAASVRDIAREAKLTQAALYYHFKNKEEVLFTITARFSDHLFNALVAALSQERKPVERLANAVRTHILFTRTHRREVKLVLEDKKFLSPPLVNRIKDKERSIFNLYRTYLQELRASGHIRPVELLPVTFSILGIINFLYHWYRSEKPLSIEQVADASVDLVLRGLLPGSPAPATHGGQSC